MQRNSKIVLSVLKAFGGTLSRKSLQKLVFLFCERNDMPLFKFVPFRYGCFSQELASLQEILAGQDLLNPKSEDWELTPRGNKLHLELDAIELLGINDLQKRFSDLTENEIIKHVYLTYPYYAINSTILDKILTPEEQKGILLLKRRQENALANRKMLSIGYEGYHIENYIKMLVANGVKVLCDVRKNPISRKRGFSKTALCEALKNAHIRYLHFPQLGIPSDLRQSLNSQEDYDSLFRVYEKSILSKNLKYIEEISSIFDEFGTIALLCFERDPKQCHRTRVAKKILEYRENDLKIVTS